MKLIGIILVLSIILCSCSLFEPDPVIRSLPRYKSKEFFTSGGFQDYTDYGKYTYQTVSIQQLEASFYFKPVTSEDTEEIMLHIKNFEGWVSIVGGELQIHYDFDPSVISIGDYFCIETKYGEPLGQSTYDKFDNYDVYYFDIDELILYYFHNNI